MEQFFTGLGNATITVYPTQIRHVEHNYSPDFTETWALSNYLRCESLRTVTVAEETVPLVSGKSFSQFTMWKANLQAFSEFVGSRSIDTEYAIMAEYLIPDNVWAVHAYVVKADGTPVWGLHLNDHSELFKTIQPRTPGDATKVLLGFLNQGWPVTSAKCSTQTYESTGTKTPAGILYEFESEWPTGFDQNGIPLGFSVFSDGKSTATISRTSDHPPRPGEADGNTVLKLALDVDEWAGVVNTFENETVDTWTPRDWSEHDSFSFWIYGNNSGVRMYVDLLDNRKGYSTYDDAERFSYSFVDDFSGWRRLTFRFADMKHRDIGNRAPDDGLGLKNAHGWGLGVLKTRGPMTFYIDDFELNSAK